MKPKSTKGETSQISTPGASEEVPAKEGNRHTDQPAPGARPDIMRRLEKLAQRGPVASDAKSLEIRGGTKSEPGTHTNVPVAALPEHGLGVETPENYDGMAAIEEHAYAAMFPVLPGDEMAALAANIKAHGLAESIVRYQGKVLDGRQRLAACKLAGVKPRFSDFDGDEAAAVQFVLAKNIHRRNLTKSQRAAIAAELLIHYERQAAERKRLLSGRRRNADGNVTPTEVPEKIPGREGEARKQAAQEMGVNEHYVSDAKIIKERDENLHAQVKSGSMSLGAAKKQVAASKASSPEMMETSSENGTGSTVPSERAKTKPAPPGRKPELATRPVPTAGAGNLGVVDQVKKAISRLEAMLNGWSGNDPSNIPSIVAASKNLRSELARLEQGLLAEVKAHPNIDAEK
jgi:ParB-like chromosome segregation protein Spo0J